VSGGRCLGTDIRTSAVPQYNHAASRVVESYLLCDGVDEPDVQVLLLADTCNSACAVGREPANHSPPARPPSGIKWTVGVPYSDDTRPKRFIKDYRIICPIARQNYIGLRSHQKVQGPDTLSHVWDFLISQESSEVRYRQHIHPIAVFRASIVKNVTRSQKILASPESYIYVQCFTDEEHSSYMCGARNSYV